MKELTVLALEALAVDPVLACDLFQIMREAAVGTHAATFVEHVDTGFPGKS